MPTPVPFSAAVALAAKGMTARPIYPHRVFGQAGLVSTGDKSGLWFTRRYPPRGDAWHEAGTWYKAGCSEVGPLLPHLPRALDRGIYEIPVQGGRTLKVELRRFRNAPPSRVYVIPAPEVT